MYNVNYLFSHYYFIYSTKINFFLIVYNDYKLNAEFITVDSEEKKKKEKKRTDSISATNYNF